ncbi:MAG: GntR family transcriptional regulator [Alphaproteobacteria bacterium]
MQTHAEIATTRIRDMILSGELAPGLRLQEVPLADALGISRTPVRTALNSLALQGLLHYRPKGGYEVRRFSLDELVEAYEVRSTLEGMACRLAAERGLPDDIADRLRNFVAATERLFAAAPENFDRAQWRSMNHGFHSAILIAAGNRMLGDFVEQAQLGPMASAHVIATLNEAKNIDAIRQAHGDHVYIVDALLRGQGTRAEARMREHLYIAGQILRADFELAASAGALGGVGGHAADGPSSSRNSSSRNSSSRPVATRERTL